MFHPGAAAHGSPFISDQITHASYKMVNDWLTMLPRCGSVQAARITAIKRV